MSVMRKKRESLVAAVCWWCIASLCVPSWRGNDDHRLGWAGAEEVEEELDEIADANAQCAVCVDGSKTSAGPFTEVRFRQDDGSVLVRTCTDLVLGENGREDCFLDQLAAAAVCGCDDILSLPPAEGEPNCSLCADGSIPPESRLDEVLIRTVDGIVMETCFDRFLTAATELPERKMECSFIRGFGAGQCGCPVSLVGDSPPCTLCANGNTLLPAPDLIIATLHGADGILTCEHQQWAASGVASDSDVCIAMQQTYGHYCGCNSRKNATATIVNATVTSGAVDSSSNQESERDQSCRLCGPGRNVFDALALVPVSPEGIGGRVRSCAEIDFDVTLTFAGVSGTACPDMETIYPLAFDICCPALPTSTPVSSPTVAPRPAPQPTTAPRGAPTSAPRAAPTSAPKAAPTSAPQAAPTSAPQAASPPTGLPTSPPSTSSPVSSPSETPFTNKPSFAPSKRPSSSPTLRPSKMPMELPTSTPSTNEPSVLDLRSPPSHQPTIAIPMNMPTTLDSSGNPTESPTSLPQSLQPTEASISRVPTAITVPTTATVAATPVNDDVAPPHSESSEPIGAAPMAGIVVSAMGLCCICLICVFVALHRTE